MNGIKSIFYKMNDTQNIVSGLNNGLKEQLVTGLTSSAKAMYVAAVYENCNQPLLLITHNLHQAQRLYDDLQLLVGDSNILLYPANELLVSELSVASPELKAQRIEVLNFLTNDERGIIIAPSAGLKRLLAPKQLWDKYQMKITVNDDLEIAQMLERLVISGYVRTQMVTSPGEFSVRGGIIDVFPITEKDPIRIELFDTEVESIRTFTVEDQLSKQKLSTVNIGPATEIILETDHLNNIAKKLEEELAVSLSKVSNKTVQELLSQNIKSELELLRNGQSISEIFKYVSFAYEKTTSLLDYLPANSIVMIDEVSRVQETEKVLNEEEIEWHTNIINEGKIVHNVKLFNEFSQMLQKMKFPIIYLSLFLRHAPNTSPDNVINISCKQTQQFHGQMNELKAEVDRLVKAKYTIVFLGETYKRQEKLQSILSDYNIEAAINNNDNQLLIGKAQIIKGFLEQGFELPLEKLIVFTEKDLFNKKRHSVPKRSSKLSNAERIKSYSELKIGDYVVHVNHGVGKYLGIETLEINGIHKDYLNIRYQGDDKLYVPIDQINLVQKYVAAEGKTPKLYKLGSAEWKRVKRKVQSSVQDIADDLIKLYAEREAKKGYAFTPDGDMQREFEATFMYRETEDQLRSINEIKHDMERDRPMDRLLCGDVGYGKTEVAIRAAFKAIADGKQVAFLVPTTILAQQHFETIKERFQDYPINIGLLSRFKTRKEQQETIKGLKSGVIDIVIGTHRILSKDVVYRDLGLLIIDEEQRFGVTHKEKIKQIKTNVDVLTLTATPIPRTLHMSMLGVRDLSVIETPPENRYPVQTYVMEYNDVLVREAIERELAREGQVYFLYNRVEDIERKAHEIAMLVPDARVAFAHGQMTESQLEDVMLGFLAGEFDVLVSTTIIETGVDIPNVNTLIVHNADKMGLSQLYQLRGRVGRTNRIAYSYFTYQKDKILTEVAEQRLQAIKEFTELGSGFKIAMRDLSIRGTGNILGAQQHGFIDSVGFDLYSQMLKEAIENRKSEFDSEKTKLEEQQIEIDLGIDAYIPDTYIKDGHQKIEIYKRFRGIESLEDIAALKEEMVDRFGKYPIAVQYLLDISEMKVLGLSAGVEMIKQVKDEITILLTDEASKLIKGDQIFKVTMPYGRMIGLGMDGSKFKMVIHTRRVETDKWLSALSEICKGLSKITEEMLATPVTK